VRNSYTALLFGIFLSMAMLAGCSDDGTGTNNDFSVQTLATGLEYPKGLWPKGELVYFTETAGRNTIYGGKVRLDAYDIPGGVLSVVVDNPMNAEAVVVASSSLIYLAGWEGSIPGENGDVSWVNPLSRIETHLLDVEIAVTDMHIDGADDILIVGSSDKADAKSMLLLKYGDYATPIILKAGLGWIACVTEAGEDIYYSGSAGTYRVTPAGTIELFLDRAFVSISCSSISLYYADPATGSVGSVSLSQKKNRRLLSRLKNPVAVRWESEKKRLYVLEAGTDANEFKDGALKVVYGLE
jgi:hypothetical protein